MFLTNLTAVESGQVHLLGEGKTKGTILENILGMFMYFKSDATFDFVANTYANIASLQVGRQWIIESGQIKHILICLQIPDISE